MQEQKNTFRPYVSADYVLSVTNTEVNQDICEAATAVVNNYSGILYNQAHTVQNKVYSSDGGFWLDLGVYPIVSVERVMMNESEITDYKTPQQHGKADGYLYREYGWVKGVAHISVTFKYGYRQVPSFIKLVTAQIAALLKNENHSTIGTEKIGDYSVSYISNQTTQDKINQILQKLPKNMEISAVGEDSIFDLLLDQEKIIGSRHLF